MSESPSPDDALSTLFNSPFNSYLHTTYALSPCEIAPINTLLTSQLAWLDGEIKNAWAALESKLGSSFNGIA
ncbi:hypothetical protein CC1G_13247 [Coprinopsis cinerea okayama7|uniref:Uncharacterized protein n=1 Tax=Coprinopsis cinerea (strain Okayama-7 / 130 / ATCC MYA-4618 / FGSC 9003) TaxID=240176 RepID=A8PI45_COPC7|nr:hypothetical protein CC1G_13247 [Coprinopsis cinerea okayama7\|eukprot:XP_001841515.1 hypothetical protein CC1G_13247 [Coprinopsis cinerea okayama7\